MNKLFSFLAILLLATFIGITALQDNGYILIGRGSTTIEMSLALFIILQIFLYIFIALSIKIIRGTWTLPKAIKKQHARSKINKAQQSSKDGLIALAQGQWKKAEKILLKHAENSEMPLLNYLSAARAAQKQNEPERRDRYLALAHKSMPDADFAVELTQAELQFSHGQLEQSLATLVHLKSISPKHTHVLHLLSLLYEKLNSWEELRTLLPELQKYKVTTKSEQFRLQKLIYKNLLKNCSNNNEKLQRLWQSRPKELKNDEELIIEYAKSLIKLNNVTQAEPLLKDAIKYKWNPQFIYQYGLIKSEHAQQQLDFAESLLKNHNQNAVLLLTLGRLCINLELWGKAQAYFEASLGIDETAETYREIAQLVEQLGDKEKANKFYKKGCLINNANNF